jgi:hypothetical protein
VKVLVLIGDNRPDQRGEVTNISGLRPLPTKPVRACFDFSRGYSDLIGLATLYIEDGRLYADVTCVNPEDPRLKVKLFPAVGGRIFNRKSVLIAKSDPDVTVDVLEFGVEYISFNMAPNDDDRIPSVRLG